MAVQSTDDRAGRSAWAAVNSSAEQWARAILEDVPTEVRVTLELGRQSLGQRFAEQ